MALVVFLGGGGGGGEPRTLERVVGMFAIYCASRRALQLLGSLGNIYSSLQQPAPLKRMACQRQEASDY